MTDLSARGNELKRAEQRARAFAQSPANASEAAAGMPPMAFGVAMSGMMKHGGLYTLLDTSMMAKRFDVMTKPMVEEGRITQAEAEAFRNHMAPHVGAMMQQYFFYHLCPTKYKLHSRLISYLSYPGRHLRSPVDPTDPGAAPTDDPGRTFDVCNADSEIPAAFTFVGQFIDHDLTLNAMNLFDAQGGPSVPDDASSLLDLDSVFGPRRDDADPTGKLREVPRDSHGYLRLRKIKDNGYDVCRADKHEFNQHCTALIGDKRNDENQIILQLHILLMRLHNALLHWKGDLATAQTQTYLYWQSFVFHHYLPAVCEQTAIDAVLDRLRKGQQLVHRPGRTPAGGAVLGMPHEFAIGFRFGHSQLRSAYQLNSGHPPFRLFDSLSNGADDLQGGKCLDAQRLIDWTFFLAASGGVPAHPSNIIDAKVNQVVFDLPESTIPDDIALVGNLPFRNLVRSDSVELCAGEDVAKVYETNYGAGLVTALSAAEIEPDLRYQPLFKLDDPKARFRTPLWYYLLREAEVDRRKDPSRRGRLGRLGSLLVSEVILSAIWYMPASLLRKTTTTIDVHPDFGTPADITLQSIAEFVTKHDHSPACAADVCRSDSDCTIGNPPLG